MNRTRWLTIGAASALTLSFGVWCVTLMFQVAALRAEVEGRVGWLIEVQALHVAAEALDGAPDGERLAEVGARGCGVSEGIGLEPGLERAPSVEALGEAARRLEVAQPGDEAAAIAAFLQASDAVTRELRRDTARLSRELGDRWSSMNWLAAMSLALAALGSVLSILLERKAARLKEISRSLGEQIEVQRRAEEALRESRQRYRLLSGDLDTRQQTHEREMTRQRRDAQEARARALEELAQEITHQINNTMTIARLYGHLLDESLSADAPQARDIQMIKEALDRMVSLAQSLSDPEALLVASIVTEASAATSSAPRPAEDDAEPLTDALAGISEP